MWIFRNTHTLIAAIMVGLMAAPAAFAQSSQGNAADLYREAFAIVQRLPPEDSELLFNYRNGDIGLTSEVRAALSRAAPAIRLFERASAVDSIDWGIDYSQGPATLLPHLAPMRAGTQLLAAEAQARLDGGDARGAAQLYAAGYRLADHATHDPVLINSLVGLAMTMHGHNAIDEAIGKGLIGPAESRMILEAALPVAGAEDPLGMVAAFEGERNCFSQWLQDTYMDEGGMQRFIDEMLPMLGVDGDVGSVAPPFVDMDQAAFNNAILSYDLALERTIAAVSQDDLGAAKEEVARIGAEVEAGVYGPLASLVLPSLERALDAFIRGYQRFDSTIEKLEEIRDNPDAQQDLRNAAYWYLRAIDQWNALAEEDRSLIRLAAAPAQRDELHAALGNAEPIIEIILEAAEIERCDFDVDQTWKYQGMNLALPHLDGMMDLAKLVAADALHRAAADAAESPAAVAERLAAIYHMSNHVGMDAQLRSTRAAIAIALIAHQNLSLVQQAPGDHQPEEDASLGRLIDARVLVISSGFGLRQAAFHYPAFTIDWIVARDGVRASDIDLSFAANPDDPLRAQLLTALEGFDEQTRKELGAALRELVREWSSGVARNGTITEESREARARFNQSWPSAFADWLLDPLEETMSEVNDAVRELTRSAQE